MKRINVLHFITGLDVGGAENFLLNIVRKTDRSRFDIQVVFLKGAGSLRREFEAIGVRTMFLGECSHLLIGRVMCLYRFLRRGGFDVLHTHLIHATLIGRIVGRLAGVPVIVSQENNTSNWRKRNILVNLLYALTVVQVQRIIAISEAVKRCLIEIGNVDPKKIEVLYDGVDLQEFRPRNIDHELRRSLHLEDASPIVGCIGRLDPRKGHCYVIQALSKLSSDYPNIRLILVGDGDQRERLTKLGQQLGVAEKIMFVGTQKDVRRYLSLLDVFVLPSLQEALSISLIEAMAMGKAVLATNVGGIPEVVTDGEDGLLVPSHNEQRLAEGIRVLIENKPLADRLGSSARRKVEEKFDLNTSVHRLEQIYYELLTHEVQLQMPIVSH